MKWWPFTQGGGEQCGQILLKYYYEMVANYTGGGKQCGQILLKVLL